MALELNTHLSIDTLMLDGFSANDAELIRSVLRAELTTLVEQRGISNTLPPLTNIDTLNLPSFAPDTSPEIVGKHLAQTIYRRIAR